MQSLQKNVLSSGEEGVPYDNIFVWNAYLTQPIRSRCNNTIWTLALVHGHFKQVFCMLLWLHLFAPRFGTRRVKMVLTSLLVFPIIQIRLSIYGRDFSVTLVSRRSRHFAGTR